MRTSDGTSRALISPLTALQAHSLAVSSIGIRIVVNRVAHTRHAIGLVSAGLVFAATRAQIGTTAVNVTLALVLFAVGASSLCRATILESFFPKKRKSRCKVLTAPSGCGVAKNLADAASAIRVREANLVRAASSGAVVATAVHVRFIVVFHAVRARGLC